jgi:hypothetical protein
MLALVGELLRVVGALCALWRLRGESRSERTIFLHNHGKVVGIVLWVLVGVVRAVLGRTRAEMSVDSTSANNSCVAYSWRVGDEVV